MIILGDVFWGRVNSCRADRGVSFHVVVAAVVLIMVGLDDLHLYNTHVPPAVTGSLAPLHCLVGRASHEEEPWV